MRTTSKIIHTRGIRRCEVAKTGFLILVCFLLLRTGTNVDADSNDAAGQHCYALVGNNQALFAFPIEQQEFWTWYNRGVKDNQLEYSWEVVVRDQKGIFNLGAYLFKRTGRTEENGSLERLLEEAQCSVSEEEAVPGGGTAPQILQITEMTCTVINQRVVIRVTGKAVTRVFSQRPERAYFVMQRPSGRPLNCGAPIRYLEGKGR